MTMTNPNDDMLDDLFAQARAVKIAPSDDLMARVLENADAVQPKPAFMSAPQVGLWARLGCNWRVACGKWVGCSDCRRCLGRRCASGISRGSDRKFYRR